MQGDAQPSWGVRGNTTPESVFYDNEGYDSNGTDSDTVSSIGESHNYDDIAGLPEYQQQDELFWAMERA